jgi:hypothetical protein
VNGRIRRCESGEGEVIHFKLPRGEMADLISNMIAGSGKTVLGLNVLKSYHDAHALLLGKHCCMSGASVSHPPIVKNDPGAMGLCSDSQEGSPSHRPNHARHKVSPHAGVQLGEGNATTQTLHTQPHAERCNGCFNFLNGLCDSELAARCLRKTNRRVSCISVDGVGGTKERRA